METLGMIYSIHLCTHEEICIYQLQGNSLNTIIYS